MDYKSKFSERNRRIYDKIMSIGEVHLNSIDWKDSPWLKLVHLACVTSGTLKKYNLTKSANGVCIVIFNRSRGKLILVRQFRPSFYINSLPPEATGKLDLEKYPLDLGITLELCGGRVDKENKSVPEIAREEILEECGYDVPLSTLREIQTYRYVDGTVLKESLFYVEVTDDMNTGQGGGLEEEGELIIIEEMSIDEVKEYMNSGEIKSPSSFLNGITWFLANETGMTLESPNFDVEKVYTNSKMVPNISEVSYKSVSEESNQVILSRVKLHLDEQTSDWDIVKNPIYVNVLIFNVSRKKFVTLRQFSPAAFCCSFTESTPNEINLNQCPVASGIVLKFCGGFLDGNKTNLEDDVREIVLEKSRYDVSACTLEKIICHGQIPNTATKTYFFYVQVTDQLKRDSNENSENEILELSAKEAFKYVNYQNVQSSPCFLYGLRWFFLNKFS